jgi:hypothetical protein
LMQIIAYIQSLGLPGATINAQPGDSQPVTSERQGPRK